MPSIEVMIRKSVRNELLGGGGVESVTRGGVKRWQCVVMGVRGDAEMKGRR